ncbi:NAD(P)-dependent oxidoreductase [Pseudonocardia sp. KRD291]|uniref:NAD(P)-dependent oxidoreductase n=1 Tax=Pseudonocardia sp. KRD291 TaxID=2792007 RepID=UPI001C4A58F8|nr:NAD(P)H-binding protein [Pseudonocardia sp. KRD291]MBW0102308.1 NAD(P)H-binding protein [Pseudonocardia sp. KRD291]
MKVVVFGATGGTGSHVVEQAVAGGHEVTVVARDPARLAERSRAAGVRVVTAGFDRSELLDAAVHGQDAVISALGTNGKGPVSVCTDGLVAITGSMQRSGVRRLVVVSAHGARETHDRSLYSLALWAALKEKMLDKERMEAVVESSGLDWTIVRPPTLTDGAHSGRYRTSTDLPIRLWSRISRADLAEFLLAETASSSFPAAYPRIAA